MKVILLAHVPKIGRKGEIKDVSDGHAVNLLFPKKLAVAATPASIAKLQKELAATESIKKLEDTLLDKAFETLADKTLSFIEKANDKDHLFSSIDKKKIIDLVQKNYKINLPAEFIVLDKPIKTIGEHKIAIVDGKRKISMTIEVKKG